jgi:hypothetical protein
MHRALYNGMDQGYSATTLECTEPLDLEASRKRRSTLFPKCEEWILELEEML